MKEMIKLTINTVKNFASEIRKNKYKRNLLFMLTGMLMNLCFALFNGILGIKEHISWFGSLSAYYFLIFAAKLYLYLHRRDEGRGILTATGAFLVGIDVILGGTAALIAAYKGGKQYPDFAMYVIAAYTLYKVIVSVIHMRKAHQDKNAFQMSFRKISHADALMSMLCLQTAVFFAVKDSNSTFSNLFNAVTGGLYWCIILFIALETLIRRNIFDKKERENTQNKPENG